MRRWWIALVVLAVAAVAWLLWPGSSGPEGGAPGAQEPSFVRVGVQAPAGSEGLTLTGVVRDAAGGPVAGAEISIAASEQATLTTLRCGVCGEWLLSCRAHESARSVASLLERGRGAQVAALTTRSDPEGRFRFERLAGTSFTVWGDAPGLGRGVVERAAPGDPVALFLPAPRRLEGRLRDEAGRPARGVVRAPSRRFAGVVEAQADEQGRFELNGLGEGPFALSATAPGLLPALVAEAVADAKPVDVTLRAPRRLEVRVLAQGKPADAVLSLEGAHLTRQLEVKAGFRVVEALYPGELVVVASSGALASAPQRVRVERPSTAVTLHLEPAGTVSVSVVDEAGQPVTSPSLELFTPAWERVAARRLQTGELATFGPLAQGDYVVRGEGVGYQAATLPVALRAGELGVELVLARGVTIAGRVVDEYGRPAPGVSVLVGPIGDSVVADAEGRFLAPVPSAGQYVLHAHHSDWGGIDRRVEAPAENVELQLEPRAGAAVTVSAEGRRVEGASVTLFYEGGSFRSDRSSGADGVVLMRGLPPGTYSLVAMQPAWLPAPPRPIVLRDGELLQIGVELQAGATLSGVVVDTTDAPVAGVVVRAAPRTDATATTDAEGKFSLAPVDPGRSYVLHVAERGLRQVGDRMATASAGPVRLVVEREPTFTGRVLGAGKPLRAFRVDGHDISSADGRFEVPAKPTRGQVILSLEAPGYEPLITQRPEQPDLGDFDLKPAARFSGRVRDEAGAPVIDAAVTCETCEQSVRTDAQGAFTLARPNLQREFTVLASKGRRAASKKVSAQSADDVELVLLPPVRVQGGVYDPAGAPRAGVEVSVIRAERQETLTAVTGGDGRYALEAPAGLYSFVVRERGAGRQGELSRVVELAGAEATVDFGSPPGTSGVSVRLVPRRGWALYLVPGDVPRVGNPPGELLRLSGVQVVYQPLEPLVTFGGLTPGRYTLVWGSLHEVTTPGPLVTPIVVPAAGEIELVR